MPAPETLKDVYADEMKDLWSANDQMTTAVSAMAEKAYDPQLKQTLEASVKHHYCPVDGERTVEKHLI
jgi:ferritin-like metal-binding protein YciE